MFKANQEIYQKFCHNGRLALPALRSGHYSTSKLARIAVITTAKNSPQLLEMVESHSYAMLNLEIQKIQEENGSRSTKIEAKSLCAQTFSDLGMSEQTAQELLVLKLHRQAKHFHHKEHYAHGGNHQPKNL